MERDAEQFPDQFTVEETVSKQFKNTPEKRKKQYFTFQNCNELKNKVNTLEEPNHADVSGAQSTVANSESKSDSKVEKEAKVNLNIKHSSWRKAN